MARYRVQGPGGKLYEFEGPDGASPADVEAAARQHFGAVDAQRQAIAADMQRLADPTTGGGTLHVGPLDTGIPTPQWLARGSSGAGAGMTSVIRAVGGGKLAALMGLPDTKEEAAKIDAPLDATTGGKWGRVAGTVAPALLALPVTPATFTGAALVGGGSAAAMTEGDALDRLKAGALGAAGGVVGQALPYALQAGKGLVRGLVESFTKAGSDRILGRTVYRFATQTGRDALDSLTNAPTVTGARPTLAEATRDPGLATLERAVSTMDPEAAAAIAARQSANNAARLQTLKEVAGEVNTSPVGPQRTYASNVAQRQTAAKASYGDAFAQGVDPDAAAMLQPQIDALMTRPSVQRSVAAAKRLAAEEGIDIGNDAGSVQGLHYMVQALGERAAKLGRAGADREAALVQQTSRDLSSVLDEIAPAYQAARAQYRANSVPINRQDVGRHLLDTASTDVRDLAGNPTLRAAPYAKALNDEGELISKATGFDGAGDSLRGLLEPWQMQRVGAIRDELETLSNLGKAANGPGSQTAKMLASQNLLRQVSGPLGLPEGFVSNAVADTALRPVQWAMRAAEDRIGKRLGDVVVDPAEAARVVKLARAYDAPRGPTQLDLLLRDLTGNPDTTLGQLTQRTAGALRGGGVAYMVTPRDRRQDR